MDKKLTNGHIVVSVNKIQHKRVESNTAKVYSYNRSDSNGSKELFVVFLPDTRAHKDAVMIVTLDALVASLLP